MRVFLCIALYSVAIKLTTAQVQGVFDCPDPWLPFRDKCYRFEQYPASIDVAESSCANNGASLVSVNTRDEHVFLSSWLDQNDGQGQQWYTSGRKDTRTDGQEYFWESDGTAVSGQQFWLNNEDARTGPGDRILYHTDGRDWGWRIGDSTTDRPYVCEISKQEIYKIVEEARGFDYGLEEMNPSEWELGPKFYIQPEEVVFDTGSSLTSVFLECAADANPLPHYNWFKASGNNLFEVSGNSDNRVTILNGKMIIEDPQDTKDNAVYQCIASNRFGSILSNTAQLKFGFLNDFPKSVRDAVDARAYQGVGIECNPPTHSYDIISFAWYKDNINNFIRPQLKTYIFISSDGKLYFSSVTKDDAGDYYCLVTRPTASITVQGGKQSMPIKLNVIEGLASEQEPAIVNGFPKAYPSNPKVGNNVRIECVAWGSPPLEYSWSKEQGGLPAHAYASDQGRVLNIPDIQLKHDGVYRCKVQRLDGQSDNATLQIRIAAAPFFTIPLEDQHMDHGQPLTWRCIGEGIPTVTYQWYLNATRLETALADMPEEDRSRFNLTKNVLHISQVLPHYAGMYQCAATNSHGRRFSSAQLRVMSFPPTFRKYPLQPNQYGTLLGNATIICQPEAAPAPTEKLWFKNDVPFTPSESPLDRIYVLPNGNLRLTNLQTSDAATYKCVVDNGIGRAGSEGKLTILPSTTVSNPPKNMVVEVNRTAFFNCEASFNPIIDMSYDWWHNQYKIEFIKLKNLGNTVHIYTEPYFRRGTGLNSGGLYIEHAQFFHAGKYTCIVTSSAHTITYQATLQVIGPPSEPSGLRATGEGATGTSIRLTWWPGEDHGKDIQSYIIESKNKFQDFWQVQKKNIPHPQGSQNPQEVPIFATIENLAPNSQYQFRVMAVNALGIGDPSSASQWHTTAPAKPVFAPQNVGGGGGKVGDLTITWDALPPEQHNGPNIGYEIKWKQTYMVDDEWEMAEVLDVDVMRDMLNPSRLRYVHLVGSDNFYKPYTVMVTAYNSVGYGPPSRNVTIMSAEDIPKGTPTNVQAVYFNSTAILVEWLPVQNTREDMKGVLIGYRINYWIDVSEDESMAQFRFVTGQRDSGVVIGLHPNTFYQVNVQAINSAGNGPKSESYLTRTLRAAPLEAPQEVEVATVSYDSVQVEWRGVSTTIDEEPLEGYKVRYFQRGENIYVATDVDAGKASWKVIGNLEQNVVYELRVFGYSRGGDGLQSSPTVEFILGSGCKAVEDSPDKEYIYDCSGSAHLLSSSLMLLLFVLTGYLS